MAFVCSVSHSVLATFDFQPSILDAPLTDDTITEESLVGGDGLYRW